MLLLDLMQRDEVTLLAIISYAYSYIISYRITYQPARRILPQTACDTLYMPIETSSSSPVMHAYGKGKLIFISPKIVRGVG